MSTTAHDQDLINDLHAAQDAHAKCIINASKVGLDINEACSLTAMKANECYRDWARYRAPFKTPEAEAELAELMKANNQ